MAKRQSVDLQRTGEFFDTLLTHGFPKEEINVGPRENSREPAVPGIPPSKTDLKVRFSEPPAPPPRQPLPEKPDVASRMEAGDSFASPGLKRSDTEKANRSSAASPTKPPGSQHVGHLVESLTMARRQIEAQSLRLSDLEGLLHEERTARTSAEDRAEKLYRLGRENGKPDVNGEGSSTDVPSSPAKLDATSPNVKGAVDVTSPDVASADTQSQGQQESVARLQRRLETMVHEMKEMKQAMESYRQRAEAAEEDSASSRRSLAEMVEKLRRSEAEREAQAQRHQLQMQELPQHAQPTPSTGLSFSPSGHKAMGLPNGNAAVEDGIISDGHVKGSGQADGRARRPRTGNAHGGTLEDDERLAEDEDDELLGSRGGAGMSMLMSNTATALTRRSTTRGPHDHLVQSAPYASILGVVALGVGIMAYLNGWQKVDR